MSKFISSLLFAIVVMPLPCSAEDLSWAVVSGFESWHSHNRDDLNPHNAGIGLRLPDGYTVGAYHNSIRRESVYAGREWQWRLVGDDRFHLNVGGVLGAVTGYKGGVHPLAVAEVVVVTGRLETAVVFVPRTTKNPITLALQLRWQLR